MQPYNDYGQLKVKYQLAIFGLTLAVFTLILGTFLHISIVSAMENAQVLPETFNGQLVVYDSVVDAAWEETVPRLLSTLLMVTVILIIPLMVGAYKILELKYEHDYLMAERATPVAVGSSVVTNMGSGEKLANAASESIPVFRNGAKAAKRKGDIITLTTVGETITPETAASMVSAIRQTITVSGMRTMGLSQRDAEIALDHLHALGKISSRANGQAAQWANRPQMNRLCEMFGLEPREYRLVK